MVEMLHVELEPPFVELGRQRAGAAPQREEPEPAELELEPEAEAGWPNRPSPKKTVKLLV